MIMGEVANTNLSIWDEVQSTDPDATKQYKGAGGFSGTAVNATYLTKKATKLFGPMGIGWGAEIVSEYVTEGAPISWTAPDSQSIICNEKIHTMRVKLWYILDGKRGEVEHFGHTDVVYRNKFGLQTEREPSKKSFTDGLKKCLSMLGFAADVFLGEFDDPEYVEQVRTEFDIERAESRETEVINKRDELTEYVRRHLEAMKSSVSLNELNGIAKSVLRHLERQGKIRDLTAIAQNATRAINAEWERKKEELSNATV